MGVCILRVIFLLLKNMGIYRMLLSVMFSPMYFLFWKSVPNMVLNLERVQCLFLMQ